MITEKSVREEAFNEENLSNYVSLFSFPRLAGSEGEKKAVKLTKQEFNKIGFTDDQIILEPFEFSNFYSTTLIKLIAMINLIFLLMIIFFSYVQLIIAIFILLGLLIIISLIIRGLQSPEDPGFWGKYYGETFTASNVIAKIPAKNKEKVGDLIFSAHLDSKSQSFRTRWRVVIYRIWLFSAIILGIFYIIFIFQEFTGLITEVWILEMGIWIPTLLISISNLLLMNLNTHNQSPGALDNASGMAIVFELSSFFVNNPLDNFNIWFCQYSAEELGTMGSRVFVKNHEENFKQRNIFQINFDMVSCKPHRWNQIEYLKSYGIFPRRKLAPLLGRYIDQAAEELNIEVNGFHLTTGAHTDSVPFHQRNFDSIDIVTRAASIYSHTKRDTPDKVDSKILKQACVISQKVALNLDKDFHELCKTEKLKCDDK
ncbi:MAG: M28 family peptidase [Candidatus Lokiarchaeota archaeon]|nr:M28 family peptidase [Candidatus Lokiarchaeota archaeon]MBD3200605.1 M28 family peptidase [Candidatus Lokiarchaeota archaeon]